jgi:hypothetical protein
LSPGDDSRFLGKRIWLVGLSAEREAHLRWKRYYAAALMLAIATSAGSAAEAPCFELYQNANASGPEGTILLNKCTGETWLLVTVNTGSGSSIGWHPIPIDMSSGDTQTKSEESAETGTDTGSAD